MKTFLNLPVQDLQATIGFFTELGFTFNPNFTDENATCMIINEESYVMLLVKPYFSTFITKEIPDPKKYAQHIMALSCDSKEEVDRLVTIAIENGAEDAGTQDMGFMYTRKFADLDGHQWELFWMDPSQVQ